MKEDSPKIYLLVDGHSVIFAWPGLRQLHQSQARQAREVLIHQLRRLHDTSAWRITLVFDGRQGGEPIPRSPKEMAVIYSQKGETADSVIERLVGGSGKATQILVITQDNAERMTVESLGASTADATWLLHEIERHDDSFSKRLEQIHDQAKWKSSFD